MFMIRLMNKRNVTLPVLPLIITKAELEIQLVAVSNDVINIEVPFWQLDTFLTK
jgi:hypothetical protein